MSDKQKLVTFSPLRCEQIHALIIMTWARLIAIFISFYHLTRRLSRYMNEGEIQGREGADGRGEKEKTKKGVVMVGELCAAIVNGGKK